MDEQDKEISTKYIINKINNLEFTEWMFTYLSFSNDKSELSYNTNTKYYLDKLDNYIDKIETLNCHDVFNEILGDSLSKFVKLKSINFGYCYNKPLGNSLSKLENLRDIYFCDRYNQLLPDYLLKLPKLENIHISSKYIFKSKLCEKFKNIVKYY